MPRKRSGRVRDLAEVNLALIREFDCSESRLI